MVVIMVIINYFFGKKDFLHYYGHLINGHYKYKCFSLNNYSKITCIGYFEKKYNYEEIKLSAVVYGISIIMTVILTFDKSLIIYGTFTAIFLIFLPELKVQEKHKNVQEVITNELPNYLINILLLTQSGISLLRTFESLETKSLTGDIFKNILYEVKSGSSFEAVLNETAVILGHNGLTRLTRIIIQDQKNGSEETGQLIDNLIDDLWRDKRNLVIKKGEEASTKLLLPMMIALISVLIAVTVPAIYDLYRMF